MLVVLAILFGLSLAQRPSNTSTCDYYAQNLYGANTNYTQFQLMQSIIALAFNGGHNLSNVSSEITGILNAGTFQGVNVDLRPFFNGSIDSTNLNNQAVAIDWLDDGGPYPLYEYLSGATSNVVLTNGTNQYRLFTHFFAAFSHIFGCSEPPSFGHSSGPPLSLAYVHKYMRLNYTDLGHFIDQLSRSTAHFGFSDQDSQTLSGDLNSQYNVRCAPPITLNPALGPELLSLCQASSCPLAEPNPDCAAYVNLTAGGIASDVASTQTSAPAESTVSATTVTVAPSTTSPVIAQPTSAAASSTPSKSSSSLSGGAIAGIVIGGIAALLIGVGALLYFFRQRKPPPPPGFGYTPSSTYASPSTAHDSYNSNVPIAEMESPRVGVSPEMGNYGNQRSFMLAS